MLPQIALHIGAHKTATTHLQRSLSEQVKLVRGIDARFYGPPYFRNGPSIARRFGLEGDVTPEEARIAWTKMAGQTRRVLLSEENFIGTMHNRFAKMDMPLYPHASNRIGALADRIASDGIDVFLGIRNPAHYVTSGYCQALMGGHKVILDDVKAQNPVSGVDWADLVSRLRQTDGIRDLVVWCYEDYKDLFSDIVARMIGPDSGVQPLQKIVHQGLSTDAVAAILRRYAAGKGRQAAVRARNTFPIGPDHPQFDAFTPQEHAAAKAQYDRQLAHIAAMPDITFLQA